MRSGAEQSGSMVSAGAPRGAGQPGQGPPGVSGHWPGGSRTLPGFILSPAPARTQAHPSSSEHSLQPWELLGKVRGAPRFG